MGFNKFHSGIIVRVILIAFSGLLLAFLALCTNLYYCILATFMLLSALTWNLIAFITKQGKELRKLLIEVKEHHGTLQTKQRQNPAFKELNYFIDEINHIIQHERQHKQEQQHLTDHILNHAQVGLLAFDTSKVLFINPTARKLLSIHEIKTLKALAQYHPQLTSKITSLKPGISEVYKIQSNGFSRQLSILRSTLKFREQTITLLSLQDIQKELAAKEAESWQKLIRILSHEITNAITPVTSLTSTISNFFIREDQILTTRDLTNDNIQQAVTGLELIEERGNAVLQFVRNFKSLAHLPAPELKEVNVSELFKNVVTLKHVDLAAKNIAVEHRAHPVDLTITCDKGQMEQVLINLVNNAIDAICETTNEQARKITLTAYFDEQNQHTIQVADTGKGIPESLHGQIFVPFYTTKPTGNGIGLALSRQILQQHGGNIALQSGKDGTCFILTL